MDAKTLKELVESQSLGDNMRLMATLPVGAKAFVASLEDIECEDAVELAETDPQAFLESVEPYLNPKNAKTLLYPSKEMFLQMVKMNFCDGIYNDIVCEQVFNHQTFGSLSEDEQEVVLDTLIKKNQLKITTRGLKEKVSKNLLFTKMNGPSVQYLFGFKKMDDRVLSTIGSEYADYLEAGWFLNQGSPFEFRDAGRSIVEELKFQKILALIRDDNFTALNSAKKVGFKEKKTFKSPFSNNTLVLLILE
jgi:hypothetical protein